VDIRQRKFATRGLRDLMQYLLANKGEDELATNVLSGALEVVATDTPKLKSGLLWQQAYKEWERRNYNLEKSRPGSHRWGARWLSDEEFKELTAKQEAVKDQMVLQQQVVRTAAEKFDTLFSKIQSARQMQTTYERYRQSMYTTLRSNVTNSTSVWDLYYAQIESAKLHDAAVEVGKAAEKLAPEARDAWQDLEKERLKLLNIAVQRPKPEWPTRFEPVDPTAPLPVSSRPIASTQSADSAAEPATQPAQ